MIRLSLLLAATLTAITLTHPTEVTVIAAAALHAAGLWLPLLVVGLVAAVIGGRIVESEVTP